MMENAPENAPEHCPGTKSDDAGKADACAGCPNQKLCASGASKAPDPDMGDILKSLSAIKHKVIVLSGKGGVGKSTFTAMLARSFALDPSKEVSVLDVDICGPSQPRLLGAMDEQIHPSGSGWSPVFVSENLSVMSVGFLLNGPKDAVIWRGPKKNGLIKQFVKDVDWGPLDYLVIDTPPGTSDEHLSLVQYVAASPNTVAVIVTTPQEISLLDVRKQITFCRKVNLPIIGIVENMSSFTCPNCKTSSVIFPPTTGGATKLCEEMKLPFLGKLNFNPAVAKACDEGVNIITNQPLDPLTIAYLAIAKKIEDAFEAESEAASTKENA